MAGDLRYNAVMIRVLLVGSGDVARRTLPFLVNRFRVYALLRDPGQASSWRSRGATPIIVDLDARRSLTRIAGLAHWVLHFAPPADRGERDPRTRRLVAALASRSSLPQRLVYLSTSAVYGDCAGARCPETRPVAPGNARARRRLDAERCLRRWARRGGPRVSILRVPGIYASERLPLARLAAGTPLLCPEDDVFSNHIHADDLARAVWLALHRGAANRIYHVSDDSELRMGEYFDRVAAAFALPSPPRIPRRQASGQIPPALLSFMSESRRLENRRMKKELGLKLTYPRIDDGLAAASKTRMGAPACW